MSYISQINEEYGLFESYWEQRGTVFEKDGILYSLDGKHGKGTSYSFESLRNANEDQLKVFWKSFPTFEGIDVRKYKGCVSIDPVKFKNEGCFNFVVDHEVGHLSTDVGLGVPAYVNEITDSQIRYGFELNRRRLSELKSDLYAIVKNKMSLHEYEEVLREVGHQLLENGFVEVNPEYKRGDIYNPVRTDLRQNFDLYKSNAGKLLIDKDGKPLVFESVSDELLDLLGDTQCGLLSV